MPWELIYTSAPRLLTAGQTGFGTVARHRDIPPLVVSAVERASQFARLPGLDAGRVVFSHRVVDAAGARHHLLSRVASAGSDYTGRTNHLAHHLILTTAEAADLAAREITAGDICLRYPWRNAWSDAARWLGPDETPDLAGLPPDPKEHLSPWTEATGNALHANHLVGAAGARSGCIVIAPLKWEMRRLFAEALGNVREQGWQFTFTTEVDPGDSPGEFRWLGFTPGSPMLESVQAGRRLVLDLTRPASLPPPEPLPEKPKAPGQASAPGKRTTPPRVAAPAGGAFVEPPPKLPLPLAAQAPSTTSSVLRRLSRAGSADDDHDDGHGWRLVGYIVLLSLAVLGVLLLASGTWRNWGRSTPDRVVLQPYQYPGGPMSPVPEGAPVAPAAAPAPSPPASMPRDVPPSAAGKPASPTASAPAVPVVASRPLVPCRAAHATQLERLELPQLGVQQAHYLITSTGQERGPLFEARSNLSVSLHDPAPVLRLDYSTHRAAWNASSESEPAITLPVQWRVVQDGQEVLRVLIGDGRQQRPMTSTPVAATQDESGVIGGAFGELLQRFGEQALWLRPTTEVVSLLRACAYPDAPFVPLTSLKGDTSGILSWVAKAQTAMQKTANSPIVGADMAAGTSASVDSGFAAKSAAPRSKQANSLENRPAPTSSVASNMEQVQEQLRRAAEKRLEKLAALRGGTLLTGRFGPGTCSFFAGPPGSSPTDAVWVCDVVFAEP